jgi:hypothetical protein
MTRRLLTVILVGIPLALLAAAPAPSIDDLVRRGNAAFADRDFTAAVKLYEQVEGRATDPGLIAFNKASALYQLALSGSTPANRLDRFRQAEQQYRCAVEGADDQRRLRARFGLANSIVQGRPDDVAALKDAIGSYRDCLHNPTLDEGTGSDVRHNLEVARLLLLKAQLKPSKTDDQPKNTDSSEKPKNTEPPEPDPMTPKPGDQGMKDGGREKPTDQPIDTKDGDKPTPTQEKTAGQGQVKTLFDETPSPQLSAREAEADLRKAIDLIQEELRARRLRSARPPSGTVKDW